MSALRAKLSVVSSELTTLAAQHSAAAKFAAQCLAATAESLASTTSTSAARQRTQGVSTKADAPPAAAFLRSVAQWLQGAKSRAKVLRGELQKWRDKYHATQVALAARHESLARLAERLASTKVLGSREEVSLNSSLLEDEEDLKVCDHVVRPQRWWWCFP